MRHAEGLHQKRNDQKYNRSEQFAQPLLVTQFPENYREPRA